MSKSPFVMFHMSLPECSQVLFLFWPPEYRRRDQSDNTLAGVLRGKAHLHYDLSTFAL